MEEERAGRLEDANRTLKATLNYVTGWLAGVAWAGGDRSARAEGAEELAALIQNNVALANAAETGACRDDVR